MPIDVVAEATGPLDLKKSDGAALAKLTHNIMIAQFARLTEVGVEALTRLFVSRSSVEDALEQLLIATGIEVGSGGDGRGFAERLVALRRGQAAFREGLLAAFERACCISSCAVEPALEAAHIQPYRGADSHAAGNGLLLRADLHTLFDLHMITVMPFGAIRTAPDLAGSEYEQFDERQIIWPRVSAHRPARLALTEHNSLCSWLNS